MTLCLVGLLVLAQPPFDEERAALDARLAAEAQAVQTLLARRENLKGAIELLTRLTRASQARAKVLERELAFIDAAGAALAQQAQATDSLLQEQVSRLKPRLLMLYRLRGKRGLGALLTANDFVSGLRRQRSMAALVDADARALEELGVLAEYQHVIQRRVETLEESARGYLVALKHEHAAAKQRMTRLNDAVLLVGAQTNQKTRVVADLEATQKELRRLAEELSEQESAVGFRARKGQMVLPAANGLVEGVFGRVVNPRFNTVTVQKGLDIRAPEGSEVVTVAEGKVVFTGSLKGYGNLVIVDHGGDFHTLYAHLASMSVALGAQVDAEEPIGLVGETGSLKGAYLYFEIRKGGLAIDPLPWIAPDQR